MDTKVWSMKTLTSCLWSVGRSVGGWVQVELTGQSLLDFIHHRHQQGEGAAVLRRPSSSTASVRSSRSVFTQSTWTDEVDRLTAQGDCVSAGGAAVQTDSSFMASLLSTGARRSFFCRMKRVHRSRKCGVDQSLPSTSKQNGALTLQH